LIFLTIGWNYITVTKSGLAIKIYVNSVLEGTINLTYNINYATRDLVIAYPNGYGSGYFDGTIDEVLIYNRALSEEEIKAIYNYYIKKKTIER
jgi:hypothetical protein